MEVSNESPIVMSLYVSTKKAQVLTLLFLACWARHAFASEPIRTDRYVQHETELLSDLADGKLDGHNLVDAALILGGVGDLAELQNYRGKLSSHVIAACRVVVGRDESDVASTSELSLLLDYMHDRLLTEYVEDCNDVRRALDDGQYNCVTATILYCYLAEQSGLKVQPMSLPGHVRVIGDGIVVEPTCADWFKNSDQANTSPAKSGRVLSKAQLLAKIYYNRGLDFLKRGDNESALAATEMSWQLDPLHERARDNVATVINNWALEKCDESAFDEALDLLSRGRELAGDHPLLSANEEHIRQRKHHFVSSNKPTTSKPAKFFSTAKSPYHGNRVRFRSIP